MDTPRYVVWFDVDAVAELTESVTSRRERKAIRAVVVKLGEMGERLSPPHMKPLRGLSARGLRELRPRRGDSAWRLLYRRFGPYYVLLAVAHKDRFDAALAAARHRALRYGSLDDR